MGIGYDSKRRSVDVYRHNQHLPIIKVDCRVVKNVLVLIASMCVWENGVKNLG
jgi:hypothetical protein